ncbi:MAG: hypothetical protein HON53_19805 [Planctomycetaceae bacterium]|jgi:ion channel-forming bestrophin family protein|nr:hypothetical protein [Planctomycetaceae bacterium]MBT6157895.1 hypothetical protein [Planctomycetaceae bacterium]MBT6487420.1 hypothetical protein [Planctomycetaceae bacterium]MBT6496386.1 hypothetical protein [Planctomycetaceae bacterium]
MDEPQPELTPEVRPLRYSFWTGAMMLQGSVTPRVLPNVLKFGLVAEAIAIVALATQHFWNINLSVPVGPFSAAGAVLGLLLVLRTNAGYDRWWEARKLWGGIVNQSRNLAVAALNYGPDDANWRKRFVLWTAAFPHVIRRSLREERELPEVSRLLGPADTARIAKAEHMPGVVSGELSRMLHHAADHGMSHMAFFQAEQQRGQLIDYLGGCERIRNTPLARSSAIQVRRFILMFLVSLPFALLGQFDYELFAGTTILGVAISARLLFVPLFVMLMAYPLLSLDRIGMELQNPFDTRRLDHLPLDNLCRTIERNVMELLREDTVAGQHAPELQSTDLPSDVVKALAGSSPTDTYIS